MSESKSQLTVIFMTIFIYLVGFGIIIPIIPILSRDLGASATEVGLLMSIYSFAQFLFSPFWGRLSDRFGRRPILLFCMFCEGLSYLLFAFSQTLPLVFLARGLGGFFGASISTSSAAISDVTKANERSKGMALIGVAFGLGFILGPALGGLFATVAGHISDAPHFKSSFSALAVSFICFANFIFAWFKFKETLKEKGAPSPEKKSRITKIFHNLKVKTVGPLMLIYFLVTMAMAGTEATLILYMGEKFQWGIKEISYGFVYVGFIMLLTQGYLVRKLLPRIGERKVLTLGLVLFTLGLGGIGFSPYLGLLTVMMTLFAMGNGLINPSILGSISILTSQKEQGEKLGIAQSMSSLARILGPPLGGYVYGHWMIESPFFLSAGISFAGLIVCSKIFSDLPEAAQNKQKRTEFSLSEISFFQFDNLIKNRVPFLLINYGVSLKNFSEGIFQAHIDKHMVNLKPEETVSYVKEKNIPQEQSMILICANGKASEKQAQVLESMGYKNVYFISGGFEKLSEEKRTFTANP